MTFDEFVDIHKDATPLQKLNLLMETGDIYSHSRVQACVSHHNFNDADTTYYHGESDQMEKRMRWLYDELKVALGGAK